MQSEFVAATVYLEAMYIFILFSKVMVQKKL